MGKEQPVIVYHYPAALLSPVLQGVETVIAETRRIDGVVRQDAENAAFLVDTHTVCSFARSRAAPMKPKNSG